MSFRRKVYYIILVTVTTACVLWGIARHYLGMGLSGRNIIGIAAETDETGSEEAGTGEFKTDLDRFLSVEMKGSAANIAFEYGDTYSISGTYSHEMEPEFEVKHSKLTISQVDASEEHILGVRDSDCVMTVTIPKDAYFSGIDIDLDVGTVNIDSIDVNNVKVHVGTGNLLTDGVEFNTGQVQVDTGSIKMSDIHFTNLLIDSGSGDVSLTSPDSLDDCSMALKTDVGDVRVFGDSYYTRYESTKNNGKHSLTINSETGNVTVDKEDR